MEQIKWAGTCAICMWPVLQGDEMRVRPGKRTFHKKCAERYPDAHYLKLEHRLAAREARKAEASSK